MNESVKTTSPEDGEFHPLNYLIVVAKHSGMIISVTAAVTVLTFLYLFCSPDIYKATARLLPPQQNLTMSAQLLESLGAKVSPGGSGAGAGGGMGGMAALLGIQSPAYMYVAMMTSESVLDRIIDRFHLIKTGYREDARRRLSSLSKIFVGPKDGIIVVEVTWNDPKLAADVANSYIEEFHQLLQGFALQEARERLAFSEKERLQASQNLTKAEEAVRLHSEKHGVLQIDTQTRGAIQYSAQLRAEIDAKEINIQVLRQAATPYNYDVVRMETEVKGLKEKLRNAESQFENCLSDVCLPTSKAPGLGLEYLRLFREAKFQENLYQLFARLVEVARLDVARDVAVVQVLAPAMPPELRANTRINGTLVAGILTFLVMVLVAFGQEYIQNLNNREDVADRLSVLKGYLSPWTDLLIKVKNVIWRKKNY